MSSMTPEKIESRTQVVDQLQAGVIELDNQLDPTKKLVINVFDWVESWLAENVHQEKILELDFLKIREKLREYNSYLPQESRVTVTDQAASRFLYIVQTNYVTNVVRSPETRLESYQILGRRIQENPHYLIEMLADKMEADPMLTAYLHFMEGKYPGSTLAFIEKISQNQATNLELA